MGDQYSRSLWKVISFSRGCNFPVLHLRALLTSIKDKHVNPLQKFSTTFALPLFVMDNLMSEWVVRRNPLNSSFCLCLKMDAVLHASFIPDWFPGILQRLTLPISTITSITFLAFVTFRSFIFFRWGHFTNIILRVYIALRVYVGRMRIFLHVVIVCIYYPNSSFTYVL